MTTDQKKKLLKAKIAVALQDELGRVPKEEEVNQVFLLTRVMYKAVLGLHYKRQEQKKTGHGESRQYLFHGFQVKPLAGYVPGVPVLGEHGDKLVGFALGPGDTGLAEGLGGFPDPRRITLGPGDYIFLIGPGLVDLGISFLAGPEHVIESFPDLFRGLHVLELHRLDVDAGGVTVQDFLKPAPGVFLNPFPVADQHVVYGPLAHHQPKRGLGGILESTAVGAAFRDHPGLLAWVGYPEQEVVEALDVVLHYHLYVDGVKVAGDHQRLGRDRCRGGIRVAAEPQLHAADLSHQHHISLPYRSRPPPVQPFLVYWRALNGAEEAQGGVLTRADGVDSGGQPDDQDDADESDHGQADAAAAQATVQLIPAFPEAGHYLVEVHFGLSRAARWVHTRYPRWSEYIFSLVWYTLLVG